MFVAFAVPGCQSAPDTLTAALIDGDQPSAIKEITDVIASALGQDIQLSAEAFSRSSLVTLEHRAHQTIAGRPATGLMIEKPEQFRLVRTNSGCAIVRLKSGDVLALGETRCRAEGAN